MRAHRLGRQAGSRRQKRSLCPSVMMVTGGNSATMHEVASRTIIIRRQVKRNGRGQMVSSYHLASFKAPRLLEGGYHRIPLGNRGKKSDHPAPLLCRVRSIVNPPLPEGPGHIQTRTASPKRTNHPLNQLPNLPPSLGARYPMIFQHPLHLQRILGS